MPFGYVGWARNAFWKFVRGVKFFILNKFAHFFCALNVVVELEESKFGGSDGGADELVDITLVFGVEKELSIFADVLLELFFELDDVFEDEFFFGGVFLVVEEVFG